MAAQYVIKANDQGRYSVLYAQLFSHQEAQAQLQDLLKNGWSEDEAHAEVFRVPRTFAQCNTDPQGYSLALCSQYIAELIEPGDLISIPDQGRAYIVQKRGRA